MLGHGEIVLAGKLGIALACCALAAVLFLHPRPRSLERKRFDALVLLLVAATRLGLFAIAFGLLGYDVGAEGSDVRKYYFAQGLAALEGGIVYRDIETSYAPLFPYVIAAVLLLWESPKAIVLFAIAVEIASIPIWLAVGRRFFHEPVVRTAAILYAASPVALINVALTGQNQVWLSALLATSLLLLARRAWLDGLSGFALGLSLVAVKLLGLLFAPVLWLFAHTRLRWTIGFLVPIVAIYAVLLAYGVRIDELLVPVTLQALHPTSGNAVYLLTLFGLDLESEGVRLAATFVTAACLAGVFIAAWMRGAARRPECAIHLATLVMLAFFITSKKSYTSYLVFSYFALCLSLAAGGVRPRTFLAFAAFSCIAALEPSLYFKWTGSRGLDLLWAAELPEGISRTRIAIFAAVEIALLALYAWLFARTWRLLARPAA